MTRYTTRAVLNGKNQKTGNPKTGRKNIRWHIDKASVEGCFQSQIIPKQKRTNILVVKALLLMLRFVCFCR